MFGHPLDIVVKVDGQDDRRFVARCIAEFALVNEGWCYVSSKLEPQGSRVLTYKRGSDVAFVYVP
jgi:hypothetical protein